jgi:hypothetical protein
MHGFKDNLIGRPVLYMLGEYEARDIIKSREVAGYATARGNSVKEGDQVSGVIVADWGGSVNIQLFLDGIDQYWVTSRTQFDPEISGRNRYFLAETNEEISFEQFQNLAGPNDVGAGEATSVYIKWEPDPRGHWVFIS